jgi:hypothetical protein
MGSSRLPLNENDAVSITERKHLALDESSGLDRAAADSFIENAVGTYALHAETRTNDSSHRFDRCFCRWGDDSLHVWRPR